MSGFEFISQNMKVKMRTKFTVFEINVGKVKI